MKVALRGHADGAGEDLRRRRDDRDTVVGERVAEPGEIPAAMADVAAERHPRGVGGDRVGSSPGRAGDRQAAQHSGVPRTHGVGDAKGAHRLGDVVHADHVRTGLHREHREREAALEPVAWSVSSMSSPMVDLRDGPIEHRVAEPDQLAEAAYQLEVVRRRFREAESRDR